ncbi:MAG: ABC transporter substrate-binding protein [Accumulibacter sp.]|uniref:ABC transporter substrate-binding protein n=1 Tax=Accumulibacter sp. TaxID=2053492 RepID=UPI002FC2EA03
MAGESSLPRWWQCIAALLAIGGMLAGCAPPEPLRLGFLGGLSGRVADLGIAGRNGAMLAVEIRNSSGGVNGRMVELIVEDDKQNPDLARKAVGRLLERKVEAIIGPMTSAMAVTTVPLVNEAKLVMLSPTVTTTTLTGIDDHFLRVVAPTTEYARVSAAYHFDRLGLRRVAVAYDLHNRAYTESWLTDYRRAFESAGGTLSITVPFSSSGETSFADLAERLLRAQPELVLILANSVDAALLVQQIRKRDTVVRIGTSEWAATERLIELGGKAVEGVAIAQFIDRDSTQPAYLAFRKRYLERFGQEPGFGGLTAFDAANVVLDALVARQPGQTLKQVILARGVFSGAQSEIRFDATGDAARATYLTTIRDGTFVRLH